MIADGIAISTALFLASIIRFEIMGETPAATLDYALITAVSIPISVVLFWLYGLYEGVSAVEWGADYAALPNKIDGVTAPPVQVAVITRSIAVIVWFVPAGFDAVSGVKSRHELGWLATAGDASTTIAASSPPART